MKQGKPQGNVYFVVSFMPFGRQLASAFPEVVLECRDPRVSIAIGRLPALMRKYGFGRYAVLAEFPSGPRRYVVSATFSDTEADQLVSSPHSCPQCQAVRRAQREEAHSIPPEGNPVVTVK